jgi:hypothetical protein
MQIKIKIYTIYYIASKSRLYFSPYKFRNNLEDKYIYKITNF